MRKLPDAFRNFVNAPNNGTNKGKQVHWIQFIHTIKSYMFRPSMWPSSGM